MEGITVLFPGDSFNTGESRAAAAGEKSPLGPPLRRGGWGALKAIF